MKFALATVLTLALLCGAALAVASTATSSFDAATYGYSYIITPEAGEDLRSFHVYTSLTECDPTHYYDLVMPAGWMFDTVAKDDLCVITFWTEGDALPAGQPADFGYVHFCAPCCSSWYVSDEGTDNPDVNVVDDDSQHSEACGIQPPFDSCESAGTLMAPIYPTAVGDEDTNWGRVKALYK
jgi:hypothetical protein